MPMASKPTSQDAKMPVTTTTKAAGTFGAHCFMATKAKMAPPPTANEPMLV